jgi:hypothetical protein
MPQLAFPPVPGPEPVRLVRADARVAIPKDHPVRTEKVYTFEIKVVEVRPGQADHVHASKLMFPEGVPATIQFGGFIALQDSSMNDLVTSVQAEGSDQVQVGDLVQVKVTHVDEDLVRLDLVLQSSNVEKASKNGILVTENGLRLARKVHLGKVVKFPWQKDSDGNVRTRVEVIVKEAKD